MEIVNNDILLYDNKILNENLYHRDFNQIEVTNKWPLEKCLEKHLLNNTDYVTQAIIHNNTQIFCLEHAPELTTHTIVRASVLIGMAAVSFLGNFGTLISVRRGKRGKQLARPSWTAIYTLIFHLSIADLLVTVFCIGGEAAWLLTVQWIAGNIGCKLFKFLQMFALYLSTFILVLIGVDRWLAVKYPLKSMGTATRNGRLVIAAWILSLLLSLPQVC